MTRRALAMAAMATVLVAAPAPPLPDDFVAPNISGASQLILASLDEPISPPCIARVRGPPLWEIAYAGQVGFDPQAQPAPDCEFDHSISASCGKDSLTRPRSRSTGSARALGYLADIPRPVG
jgi:hypothetical protein